MPSFSHAYNLLHPYYYANEKIMRGKKKNYFSKPRNRIKGSCVRPASLLLLRPPPFINSSPRCTPHFKTYFFSGFCYLEIIKICNNFLKLSFDIQDVFTIHAFWFGLEINPNRTMGEKYVKLKGKILNACFKL